MNNDRVERSNLNRLPGARLEDIGKFKVHVMKRMINEMSPYTEVIAIPQRVDNEISEKAIAEGDIIIAGLDNFAARFETQVIAVRYLKPLIDVGSGINLERGSNRVKFMGGQVAILYARRGLSVLSRRGAKGYRF